MPNICLNSSVWDKYRSGYTLNDAIADVFKDEISERVQNNKKYDEITPLQMVMLDAGIAKSGTLQDIMKQDVNNSAYISGGMDTNQWLFPAWVETTLRENLYDTDILPYLVNTRIGVDATTVQSPTLDLMEPKNKKAIMKARIAEGADIPTGKITIGERAITLWKRGRAIELTYEAARRMRIELFQRQMRAIASDLAHQDAEAAIDVAINGDGNKGSEAQKLGATSASGSIKPADIIEALLDYSDANHFNANTIVAPKKYVRELAMMMYDSQLAMGPSMNVTFNFPQMSNQRLDVVYTNDLQIGGKDAIVLLNRDLTLVRYQENGSNIQEMDNFIRNQTRLMTLTENSGYAIQTAGSNMYIEVTA